MKHLPPLGGRGGEGDFIYRSQKIMIFIYGIYNKLILSPIK
jgi:hypothetical protein